MKKDLQLRTGLQNIIEASLSFDINFEIGLDGSLTLILYDKIDGKEKKISTDIKFKTVFEVYTKGTREILYFTEKMDRAESFFLENNSEEEELKMDAVFYDLKTSAYFNQITIPIEKKEPMTTTEFFRRLEELGYEVKYHENEQKQYVFYTGKHKDVVSEISFRFLKNGTPLVREKISHFYSFVLDAESLSNQTIGDILTILKNDISLKGEKE